MRQFLSVALFGVLLAVTSPAQADTFVWKDDVNGYTLSFPDSWKLQTPDGPNTRVRIAGPIGEDVATCRMQVRHDGRALIYPKRLVDEAVVNMLNEDYWRAEIGQYERAALSSYYAPASLGNKGDASAVHVGFVQDIGEGQKVPMHAIMLASLYGEDLYVASCSARAELYEKYSPVFMSILDSVELKSKYHPFATGYYRNFLMDPKLALPRVKPGTIHPKNAFWFRDGKYNR